MYDLYGVLPGSSYITGLFAAILGFSPYGQATAASALLTAVLALAESSTSFFSTHDTVVLQYSDSSFCRALRFTYPSRFYLFNVGHEIEHSCDTEASILLQQGTMTSGYRSGCIQISFDAFYGTTLIQHKTVSSGSISYYCNLN